MKKSESYALREIVHEWFVHFGPLLAFFVTFQFFGFYRSTLVLIACALYALFSQLIQSKQLPVFVIISSLFVLIFGGATIHFHNPQFLIIKDSIFDALLGTVFILCPLIKRNILKELFDNLLALKESGWQMISYAWGIFFMASAGLNEFVRQHFHVSIWVEYKAINTVAVIVFGGILFLFAEKFRDSQFSNRFGIRIKR